MTDPPVLRCRFTSADISLVETYASTRFRVRSAIRSAGIALAHLTSQRSRFQ
jgi:hypothetical protein